MLFKVPRGITTSFYSFARAAIKFLLMILWRVVIIIFRRFVKFVIYILGTFLYYVFRRNTLSFYIFVLIFYYLFFFRKIAFSFSVINRISHSAWSGTTFNSLYFWRNYCLTLMSSELFFIFWMRTDVHF